MSCTQRFRRITLATTILAAVLLAATPVPASVLHRTNAPVAVNANDTAAWTPTRLVDWLLASLAGADGDDGGDEGGGGSEPPPEDPDPPTCQPQQSGGPCVDPQGGG